MSSHAKERTRSRKEQVDVFDSGVDVLDDVHPEPERRHRGRRTNPLEAVWNFLISMRTGLWLILILGLLTLAGTMIVQATPDAMADPEVYQAWYENGPQQKYGGWAPILSALGLYNVFGTWYFRALFAILAISILACSINRAPRLWRTATQPRIAMREAFFTHAPLRAAFDLPMDAEAAAERVREGLHKAHFRGVGEPAEAGADLYGDKFRWAPFGTVIAHISFIIILLGFVVSASMGFRDEQFVAPVGVQVEVGHDTGMSVVAHSFHDDYYENGQPKDYVSDLEVFVDGQSVARQQIRVNEPLIIGDVWFHQSFFGIGADLLVTEGDQEVFKETVSMAWRSNDGTRTIGQLTIPSKNLSAYIVQAASGQVLPELPAGSLAVEVYRVGESEPLGVQVLTQGQSAELEGLTWTFERNRQYTGITIKRDPGSNIVWVGSALLVIGSCLVFFLPHRRVWARVRPNADGTTRVMVGAPNRRDPGMEPVFAELLHHIQDDDAQRER